jgi:hypothetical protein
MMSDNYAYCGLNCTFCPAFIAKQNDDQELREKTAKEWSAGGFQVTADQINCTGCHESENIFMHCTQCGVRNCAQEKGVSTCAECAEYPCSDKLEALWNQLDAPKAKKNLESLRN